MTHHISVAYNCLIIKYGITFMELLENLALMLQVVAIKILQDLLKLTVRFFLVLLVIDDQFSCKGL
jgi:hypothetical protein